MTLTTTQCSVYNILLGMSQNGPLTDDNRALLLSVDLSQFGIADADKQAAIRMYEHVIGCIFKLEA
jgi:hypothetical protein